MSYANSELLPSFGSWYLPLLGREPYNKKNVEEGHKASLKKAQVVESHLTENTYLVGERLTLADIFAAGVFARAFSLVLDKEFRSKHVAITRWFTTVINQPIFKAVLENPVIVDEAIKYTPPKKEAPKKEEKPKPKKDEKADEEDDEGAPKPEPKAKHPLEALGKPTLILDEWKREYSNNETREAAMPWFWTHFKPEEYSLWLVDYKYNNELKLTFMANNLIGMWPFYIELASYIVAANFSFQVASLPVSRLPASTSLVLPLFTVRIMTVLSVVPSWSAVRSTFPPSMLPPIGKAMSSRSLTTPTRQTANSSKICGHGMSQ